MNIYTDTNAAGGWDDVDAVARRLCTELWRATNAFAKITNYFADVVIDYEIVKREIVKLTPGQYFLFTYYVHNNGTHFAVMAPETNACDYAAHVGSIANNFFNPEYSFYTGYVRRNEIRVTPTQTWDPKTYSMSIDEFPAHRDHVEVTSPMTSLPLQDVVQD